MGVKFFGNVEVRLEQSRRDGAILRQARLRLLDVAADIMMPSGQGYEHEHHVGASGARLGPSIWTNTWTCSAPFLVNLRFLRMRKYPRPRVLTFGISIQIIRR
eukprot:scaffold258159_cov41-Prasinocladus_malaysianus.AAC.2